MSFRIDYIKEEGGLILLWEGFIRGDEVIRSYHERYSPLERLKELRYIITDYSVVSGFEMTPEEIRVIAEISNRASKSNSNLYAVAVMPIDIGYGIARMWQAYAEDDETGWHTIVVRTRKEAEGWLLNNLSDSLTFGNARKNASGNTMRGRL